MVLDDKLVAKYWGVLVGPPHALQCHGAKLPPVRPEILVKMVRVLPPRRLSRGLPPVTSFTLDRVLFTFYNFIVLGLFKFLYM